LTTLARQKYLFNIVTVSARIKEIKNRGFSLKEPILQAYFTVIVFVNDYEKRKIDLISFNSITF